MIPFSRIALCISAFILPASSFAQDRALVAVTFDEEILRIDPTTGAGTLIGHLPANADAYGVGYYEGKLWVLDQTNDRLLALDAHTLQLVNTLAIDDDTPDGLIGEGDFKIDADGVGYYVENAGDVALVDLSDGSTQLLSRTAPDNVDGLAFSPAGGIYAYQTGGSIYSVSPTTYSFTKRFDSASIPGVVAGMEFAPDGLPYVAVDDRFYRLNLATQDYTLIGDIGFDNVCGLTMAVIPEPATLFLVAPFTALLLSKRKRTNAR